MNDKVSFCRTIESELTAWKARAYDLMRETDRLEAINKKPAATVQNVYAAIDELQEDIDELKNGGSADCADLMEKIGKKIDELKQIWADLPHTRQKQG
jgi:hypothetical protein